MSKLSRVGRTLQKQLESVKLPKYIDAVIKSGSASTGPPLGPMLGQRGIPIAKFATDFNEMTKDMRPGIPIPTLLTIDGKKYKIQPASPTSEYLLRQAAGIKKSERPILPGGEIVGKVTHKHLYEIASVKMHDEYFAIREYTLKQLCEELAQNCWEFGIEVVRHIDPDEYHEFLLEMEHKEEEFLEERRLKELELKKKMKLT